MLHYLWLQIMNMHKLLLSVLSFTLSFTINASTEVNEAHDPAEISIGERLILETRFSQAYYANSQQADPVMNKTVTTAADLRGPYAGKTMNCRACHMVDEHAENPLGGMRSYADYASRPPVPARSDGATTSLRNSMSMVNISIPRNNGIVFHYDGQFNSIEDLVRGTFTGRNFGWLASESSIAIKHIAQILRSDDGQDELAKEFGGSYRKVLKGTDKEIPKQFQLPVEFRIDVDKASDKEILDSVAKLIGAYVTDLSFARDEKGNYSTSPYDIFLKKNQLPTMPEKDESVTAYNNRLLDLVNKIESPRFVDETDSKFSTHTQVFKFGNTELTGMKLFFNSGKQNQTGGNCASCHAAPHFSDFGFHNTGLTQHNYDNLHGSGEFMKLVIPGLKERNSDYDAYLPATTSHPDASSRFRSISGKNKPGYTDLGLWNVFANPDMPGPQEKLHKIICEQRNNKTSTPCSNQSLLPLTIAAFKTPVLRDLGHSSPYMHTGQHQTLEQAVSFYVTTASMAKTGQLRNSDKALQDINLGESDIEPLVLFLKSLNEDYQ